MTSANCKIQDKPVVLDTIIESHGGNEDRSPLISSTQGPEIEVSGGSTSHISEYRVSLLYPYSHTITTS